MVLTNFATQVQLILSLLRVNFNSLFVSMSKNDRKKKKYIVSKQKHKQLRSVTIYILPADKFVWFDIYPKSTVQRFVGFVYKIYAIEKKVQQDFCYICISNRLCFVIAAGHLPILDNLLSISPGQSPSRLFWVHRCWETCGHYFADHIFIFLHGKLLYCDSNFVVPRVQLTKSEHRFR